MFKLPFRWLLLPLLLGWLAAGPGRPAAAQTAPPLSPADSLAAVAREDTAIALQRLFFARRRQGLFSALAGGAIVGTTGYLLLTNTPETTYQRLSTGGLVALTAAAVYGLAQQLVQVRRFRTRRELRLLASLEAGQPLPPWLRRQLKPNYFSTRMMAY